MSRYSMPWSYARQLAREELHSLFFCRCALRILAWLFQWKLMISCRMLGQKTMLGTEYSGPGKTPKPTWRRSADLTTFLPWTSPSFT